MTTSDVELREQVRDRYAAAATAVSAGRPAACGTGLAAEACCGRPDPARAAAGDGRRR